MNGKSMPTYLGRMNVCSTSHVDTVPSQEKPGDSPLGARPDIARLAAICLNTTGGDGKR